MHRVVPLGLAVLLALAAGCGGEPTQKYTVRVESGFGGPVNWTSLVEDTGARNGGVLPLTAYDSAAINLSLAPGQRATVQVAIEPGRLGYATCTPYLGEQPLGPKLSQEGGSARLGVKPPVTCELVGR